MRPQILYGLFTETGRLKGVGPRYAKLIEKAAGPQIVDLLWHLPSNVIDRRPNPAIREATEGMIATIKVTVLRHEPGRSRRTPYRVVCRDDNYEIDLVFFHARADWISKILPVGEQRIISGKIERYRDKAQMPHPDHVVPLAEEASVRTIEPTYPTTEGLPQKTLRKAISAATKNVPDLTEWISPSLLQQRQWPSWKEAVDIVHHPASSMELDPTTIARSRLAYDELLSNQIALALVRARMKRQKGRSLKGNGHLREQVLSALPFEMTGAQRMAVAEILGDMADESRMLRLLQGDVGSGKTLVALVALLNAVECGGQGVLMAPTEILARQHFATIEPLARKAGVRCEILTGRDKGKARSEIVQRIAEGSASIVVGTHALFQEGVSFRNLGLVIIDEQHRFGVHQRLALGQKGEAPHMLLMSATPIPRSLVLALYGDLDISKLLHKPAGRQPIKTIVKPQDQWGDVALALRRAIEAGDQAYWICPLVEETEVTRLTAAEDRHAMLQEMFGPRVGLVHGRMKGEEKDAVMRRFKAHELDILVATTVVEVGVDVPNATVMVIEHAERFGLAQLHQLRGRIGRGTKASTCLLLYTAPLGETARSRLSIMRESNDGFVIAEEDLRLRGAGDVMGTRQSGLPDMNFANLPEHNDLLEIAQRDAQLTLNKIPDLAGPRGEALRTLLYLFEREQAIAFLEAG